MSKLDRLSSLPGSKTKSKKPTQSELAVLVKELQALALSQQKSQSEITSAIDELTKVVSKATKTGFDMAPIVDAIASLKDKVAEKAKMNTPLDYEINFERDKFGLMKTGIKLNAVSRRLN